MRDSDPGLPEEWGDYTKEHLLEDIEFLRKTGMIEVVGINEDGEWLYGLSPTAKKVVDENDDTDPWIVISELIDIAVKKDEQD